MTKQGGKEMIIYCSKCAYCGSQIEEGHRWVREKVYESAFTGRDPRYQRFHAELFLGQELSCWERHQIEAQTARITARAA